METSELVVRIPSAKKMAQIFSILQEEEDFRFDKCKVERDKQRYTLPEPTPEDQDNTVSVKSFYGVVCYFRKAFFNNKEKNEQVEKREIALIRVGKLMPELLYISKSGFYNWKGFLANVKRLNLSSYNRVLVKFTAEAGQSTDGQYKFSKVKLDIVRELEPEEYEYIQELSDVVRARVQKYSGNSAELDEAEESFMDKPKGNDPEDDDDDAIAAAAAKRTRVIAETDDDDEDTKPKTRAKAPVEDDDEDTKPKTRAKAKPSIEDDDDEDIKPKTRAKTKAKPSIEDDDDEDLKPKANPSIEDDEPVSRKGKTYPNVDDDDD